MDGGVGKCVIFEPCERCKKSPRLPDLTLCQECHDYVIQTDPSEPMRRVAVRLINAEPGSREALEAEFGQVWDTKQLSENFDVIGFGAPLVEVVRKSDGAHGSLMFQHGPPRLYFDFKKLSE